MNQILNGINSTKGSWKYWALSYNSPRRTRSSYYESCKRQPEDICLLTFTNVGAREMTGRVVQYCAGNGIVVDPEKFNLQHMRALKDPTQEECMAAVKKRSVKSLIKNPEILLWISNKLEERDCDPNIHPEAPQAIYTDMRESNRTII